MDKTLLGIPPQEEFDKLKNNSWHRTIRPDYAWIDRHWDDALNAHHFYKADPL